MVVVGGGGGGGFELLISDITESICTKKIHANFDHFLSFEYHVSTTLTLSPITSQEFIGHIKKHFITYFTSGIQDFVKCCIKSWVHLDL